jgi:hypothetical protein
MIDTTSLFLHVLAAIGIVGGGLTQVLAGRQLRAADTVDHVRTWARFTRTAGLVILGSAVVSLLTGGHLAGAVWTTEEESGFSHPFITLGVVGLLLLAPVGPMIGGARLRRLLATADELQAGPAPVDLRQAAGSPSLWGPVHSLVGVGIGLVAVMVYKPGWVATAVILLLTFAAGWLAGAMASRRPTPVA